MTITSMTSDTLQTDFCSVLSRTNNEDPIGSAAPHQRYLLIEVPMPWDYDVKNSTHFPVGLKEVLSRCAEQSGKFRFLAFCSDTLRSPDDHVRVFYFARPSLPNNAFQKKEYMIPVEKLQMFIEALLMDSARLEQFHTCLQPSAETRELFICTHGIHDFCCGKFGEPTYQQLDEQYAEVGRIRAWRVSHLGGHRFAPTLIDFPEGRSWSHMTPDLLDPLIYRQGKFADLAGHYRGWSMWNRFEQVAERELFTRFGWEWIHFHKTAECELRDDDTAIVKIDYVSPDQTLTGTFTAEVFVRGTVTTGGCGSKSSQVKQYGLRPLS